MRGGCRRRFPVGTNSTSKSSRYRLGDPPVAPPVTPVDAETAPRLELLTCVVAARREIGL